MPDIEGTLTPEQAQAVMAETERWESYRREMNLKRLACSRTKKKIQETFAELRVKLDVLEQAHE
jgi:arginyl-tRNA synthetase